MKYYHLRRQLKGGIFTSFELKLRGIKVFPYQFSYWVKTGQIGKIKRGIYYFSEVREKIKGEEIAFYVYQPSYISLESALFHYGLIPDVTQAWTSVTTKTTRSFSNDFGRFIFRHIDPKLFFGYISLGTENGKYLLAEPEKALLDFFYLNSRKAGTFEDFEELRINHFEAKKLISPSKIKRYAKAYQSKKINEIVKLFLSYANHRTN